MAETLAAATLQLIIISVLHYEVRAPMLGSVREENGANYCLLRKAVKEKEERSVP